MVAGHEWWQDMRQKYALVEAGWRTGLIYRLHYLATLLSAPISLLIYYYLWRAIFQATNTTVIKGFTLQEMISYYVIVMIVGMFTWSECDKWIEEDVVRGDTIIALLKPFTYFSWHYYFELGFTGLSLIVNIIPVFLIGILFGLKMTTGIFFVLFLVSMILASFIYFLITFIVGLTSFWLFKIAGVRRTKRVILAFLGGSMLPLSFFPDSLQKVFFYLPFQYLRYIPANIYLQKYSYGECLVYIGIALFWCIVLFVLARLIWRSAYKKFAGAGT
jgi:ABC-2 type transport system permease protein